jgi:hypothetical protein
MDEIRNNPEGLESGQTLSSELQALDDATYEPTACVERGGDYQQAEAIQVALVTVTDSASLAQEISATPITLPDQQSPVEATPIPLPNPQGLAGNQPMVRGDLDQATTSTGDSDGNEATPINLPDMQEVAGQGISAPIDQGKTFTDPVTGESSGEPGGKSPGETKSPVALGPQDEGSDQVSPSATQAPETTEVEVSQTSSGKVGSVDEQVTTTSGEDRLTPDLPQDAKSLIGEGTHGMLDGTGPDKVTHSKIDGYGPGASDHSQSTKVPGFDDNDSSGLKKPGTPTNGPPVKSYGPGLVGKTTSTRNSYNKHGGIDINKGKSSDTAYDNTMQTWEDEVAAWLNGDGGESKYTISWDENGMVSWKGNPIDGISPIPYTGSSSTGEKPQPQKVGGPDVESGHFTPLVSIDGQNVSGGGTSGEPGTQWDEGHWYGGIFASAGRPNDPNNPDYYTPNLLELADKAKKAS